MDITVMYKVDIKLNANLIFSDAVATGRTLAEATQSVMSHEFGHVLSVDDVPPSGAICDYIQTIMYQDSQTLMRCGKLTPITPCDSNAANDAYSNVHPGPYCGCSGVACT